MLWIGITGSMGSGKSSVAKVLRQMRYVVLDADQVVRELMSPGGPIEAEILAAFGDSAKGPGGELDRQKLGQLVFGDEDKLRLLESILHPKVRQFVSHEKKKLSDAGTAVAFYDVPLLFEKNMVDQFDHILVVTATRELCIQRLQERTKLSRSEIEARLNVQLDPAYKVARASAVIHNDSDLSDLKREVESALRHLRVPLPPAT